MKKFSILLIISLIYFSCGKEEPAHIEAFSPQAFAYDIGEGWEVNASVRVRGFSQTEEEKIFTATIAYDIDLVTPEGDTLKSLLSKVEDKTSEERITEIPLEAQFELDSSYTEGEYTVIFNIKDAESEQTATSLAVFQLVNE